MGINRRPMVHDYTVCAEATSSTFWVGAPYDELAREYIAETINDAFNSPFYRDEFQPYYQIEYNRTRRDTITVSAMEGSGWMEVLALEEVFLNFPRIPAVNIRGASYYVYPPLERREDGTWGEQVEFQESLSHSDQLTVEGYKFSINATSQVLLKFFELRQKHKIP